MDNFDDIDSFLHTSIISSDLMENGKSAIDDLEFLGGLDVQKQESAMTEPDSFPAGTTLIDNDLNMFISETVVAPSNKSTDLDFLSGSEATVVSPKDSSGTQPAEKDFMAWLDDPDATPSKLSPPTTFSQTSVDVNTSEGDGLNDFLEEVFGETGSNQVITTSAATTLSGNKKYEAELRAESSSGFPDISKLRNMVLRGGYLPHLSRGHVWCILLTGGPCVDDQEAEFWKPHGGNDENIVNKSQLEVDCQTALSRLENTTYAPLDAEQSKEDLHDILLLYCMRRNISYSSLMCDLLSPLLLLSPPLTPLSRALASACFYSLYSEFIPTANLQVR